MLSIVIYQDLIHKLFKPAKLQQKMTNQMQDIAMIGKICDNLGFP
jgi:hypothetical protein